MKSNHTGTEQELDGRTIIILVLELMALCGFLFFLWVVDFTRSWNLPDSFVTIAMIAMSVVIIIGAIALIYQFKKASNPL